MNLIYIVVGAFVFLSLGLLLNRVDKMRDRSIALTLEYILMTVFGVAFYAWYYINNITK